MWRIRWYRWTVVIVGEESGSVTSVPFIRFRHSADGQRWIEEMNSRRDGPFTHYELRPIQ